MAGLWGLVWALRMLLCVLLLVHGQVRVGATGCKKRKPLYHYLLSQVSDQRVRMGLDLMTYVEFVFSCTCVYPFTCKDTSVITQIFLKEWQILSSTLPRKKRFYLYHYKRKK
jgi:hypothetical protein